MGRGMGTRDSPGAQDSAQPENALDVFHHPYAYAGRPFPPPAGSLASCERGPQAVDEKSP